MPKVEINRPEQINSLEAMQVQDYMEKKYPELYSYTMTPGNECIWVYWGSSYPMNLYFIFREGKIADIQMD